MGTISHHQAKAHEFLNRADRAIANHNPHIPFDPLILSPSKDHNPAQDLNCRGSAAGGRRTTTRRKRPLPHYAACHPRRHGLGRQRRLEAQLPPSTGNRPPRRHCR